MTNKRTSNSPATPAGIDGQRMKIAKGFIVTKGATANGHTVFIGKEKLMT